jgi:heme A synthase
MRPSLPRVATFAWVTLVFNLAVILWGAYVRATGSGAGCGDHWPTCNGDVIPRAPSLQTLIEFTHRATSGVALLLVVALAWWTRRVFPQGAPARRAAAWTVFFMFTEAAVGAGLVLFRLVADNESVARALFMAVHLCNTFVLLACMVVTAWLASGAPAPTLHHTDRRVTLLGLGLLALVVLGVSGAITALGDTLYPAQSLEHGLAQDLSPTASVLVRLRVFHPILALGACTLLVGVLAVLPSARSSGPGRGLRMALWALMAAQLGGGLLNVLLLAPVWMQLVHLLVADALWLTLVLVGADALVADPSAPAPSRA